MQKEITISNTSGNYYVLSYRMPGETTQILNVEIIAYAMNKKVIFPDDVYYNEFKKQNQHYFLGNTPILIEGKVNASKLEKINEKLADEEREVIDGELKHSDDSITAISEEYTGKKIDISVEKVDKKKVNVRGRK